MAKGKKTGGRVKGTPNHVTTSVKEALHAAFEGIGGVPKLIQWASENQTEFYKLYSKLIPVQVDAAVAHNFVVAVPEVASTSEQWKQQNPQVTIQTVQ